jgi:hypothetical protein
METEEGKERQEKPLERMTAKELRELAAEIPEIIGAHGMKKDELLATIKKARGIVEDETKVSDASVREIKKKIKQLKGKKLEALETKDSYRVRILRRQISRLKKRTRRAV